MAFYTSFRSWLLGDHLGSTSMVANASGVVTGEVRYSAFGEERYTSGTMTTDYLYTGQRQEAEIGLYYYVARWYDPAIGRFIQADSIVPNSGSAVGFDRYAYSWNNPISYSDPDGHSPIYLDGEQLAHTENYYYSHVSASEHKEPLVRDGQDPISKLPSDSNPYLPEFNPYLHKYDQGTEGKGQSIIGDLEWLLRIAQAGVDINDFIEAFDKPITFRTFKGAWKLGRYSLNLTPGFEGGVQGGLHFVSNWNDLTFLQNLGQSIFVAGETAAIDVASGMVGLSMASMGGAAGALTPIPLVDEAVGVFGGYLAGNYATTWLLQDMADEFNSALFPNLGLGEFNP